MAKGAKRDRAGVKAAAGKGGPGLEANRFRWEVAAAVFLVALLYRGLYLWEASGKPDWNLFYMDQEYHLGWARALLSGEWAPPFDRLQGEPYFRAPLYPYFLASLLSILQGKIVLVRIVQIVIGSFSCAFAYGVGAKCGGQKVGVVAGLLLALYWVLAYFDGELLLPVLLVFFLLLGFLLLFAACERGSPPLAALAGLSFGLFAVTRPNILVFFPFLFWWVVRIARALRFPKGSLFAGAVVILSLLPPACVTVRNGIVSGDWVVVASQGGVNFYIGNNRESNGMEAVVPGTRQTWWGGWEDTRKIAEESEGKKLTASEISDYWFRKAFAFIRSEPGSWLRLTARKVVAFFGDVELVNNEPYEARRGDYRSLSMIPFSFALLFGLFLIGLPRMLALSGTRPRTGGVDLPREEARLLLIFLLVYSLSIIAFFVTGRYRVPLLPVFATGAAFFLVDLWGRFRSRRFAPAAGWAVVALLLVLLLRVDFLGSREATRGFTRLTEGQDRLDTGDFDGAIERLEEVRAEGSVQAPQVYTDLVRAYLGRGRPGDREKVARVVQEGLRLHPREPELLWYATVSSVEQGLWEQAESFGARYLAERPGDLRALSMAHLAALALGKTEEAARLLEKAVAIDPHNPIVLRMQAGPPPGLAPGGSPR